MIRIALQLFLCFSFIETIAQSTFTTIGKVKLGTMFPTGELHNTRLKPGLRADLGADVYVSESVYIAAEVFLTYMSADKNMVVNDYAEQNKIVSTNKVTNHFVIGIAGGIGIDIPLSNKLHLSPSFSLFYGYLNPSRVKEYTQLNLDGQPLYKASYDIYASSAAYGIRPGVDFKYAITEKLFVSAASSFDGYFYIDGGSKKYELLSTNQPINYDNEDAIFNINARGIVNLSIGVFLKF